MRRIFHGSLIQLVVLLISCHGYPKRGLMLENELEALRKADGSEYSRLRDSLIKNYRDRIGSIESKNPPLPPSIEDILKTHAAEPEKAGKFLGALTGQNTEFIPQASALQVATFDKILAYINSFPKNFIYIGEEYLFKYSASFRASPLVALTRYYKENDQKRGSEAYALAFRMYSEKPTIQFLLLSGIVELNAKQALPDIRQAYSTTGNADLKRQCLYALASFRDPAVQREIEFQLNSSENSPFDRKVYVDAYQSYLDGEAWERLAKIYTTFKSEETKKTIAESLTFYSENGIGAWERIAQNEKNSDIKKTILNKIQNYRD